MIDAREVFPSAIPPDGSLVALGHSEGGAAAWAFSERLFSKSIPGYNGSIAIAPPTSTFDLLAEALADPVHSEASILLTQQQ
jgi:hypothetical protein